ncbi:MAG: hypothetical protein OHK0039_22930 [Bacteroidia bacterium]
METLTDVAINPDPYLQRGDLVGSAFFIESMAFVVIVIYLLFQLNEVPRRWRNQLLIGALVAMIAGINVFFRRDFWVQTQTLPVEFRFFDWFMTVPLMVAQFYLILRPLGARIGMLVRIVFASLWMLLFGYLGEALTPENVVMNGLLGTLGLLGIIAVILLEGYPRVMKRSDDPAVRRGYLALSILLPVGWVVYPLGYMFAPGNIWEGAMSAEAVSVMYSISDVVNKGGQALIIYFIAIFSKEATGLAPDLPGRAAFLPNSTERPKLKTPLQQGEPV